MIYPQRFRQAIDSIDAANAPDPRDNTGSESRAVKSSEEPVYSREVVYSHRMTAWLNRLYPEASEALQLAARAQHIRRWEIPRESYPMDRAGYHRWRTGLYSFHADVTAEILTKVGYDQATIDRVRSLLRKERLKADPETQALEDVICVVFLENYFADFAARHDEQKMIGILRRTWAKMSAIGQEAALKLPLPPDAAALVGKALSPVD